MSSISKCEFKNIWDIIDPKVIKTQIIKESDSAATFKAELYILYDESSLIFQDFKIELKECYFDLYFTKNWETKNNSNFRIRKQIMSLESFKELKQMWRPTKTSNKLIKLNELQLKQLSDFFNSKKYKSTLNNIASIIKGNNVGGTDENPERVEVELCEKIDNYKGKVTITQFYQSFINRYNNKIIRGVISAKEFFWRYGMFKYNVCSFNDFLNKLKARQNTLYHKFYDFLNSCSLTRKKFRDDFSKQANNVSHQAFNIEKSIRRLRTKANNNIKEIYGNNQNYFANVFGKTTQTRHLEGAHIIPCYLIKEEAILAKTIEKRESIIEKVCEIDNILPLDCNTHEAFDEIRTGNSFIYWEPDGKLNTKYDKAFNGNELYGKIDEKFLKEHHQMQENLKIYYRKIVLPKLRVLEEI